MFHYRSSYSAVESLLGNRLATVSEMIQSCSASTIARCFLSDGNRARAGARVVERFTEGGTKDNRRGYYDRAIPLAARHAAGRSFGFRYLGSPQQTADTDRANAIFRAWRRNRSVARIHQKNAENSTGGQGLSSETEECLHQKQQKLKTNIVEAALTISSSKRDYSRMFKPQRLNELSR